MSVTSKEVWFVQVHMLLYRAAVSGTNLQEAFGRVDVEVAAVRHQGSDHQLARPGCELRGQIYWETGD